MTNQQLPPATADNNPTNVGVENKIWTKGIHRTNTIFMVTSLFLVFGLDLLILINNPFLAPFYIAMVVVLGIFGAFYYYETRALKKKYSNSSSKLDIWIYVLVVIRNLVFVLNFIPLIQILGGMALLFGALPYLIIYNIILLRLRPKAIHAN